MSTHALYRFFDEAGELLYVGVTMNPAARWKQHSQDKSWWTSVANITVEPHRDRKAVLEAEALAIKTEHPRYNVVHSLVTSQPQLRASWYCVTCMEPIEDNDGYILVRYKDIYRYEAGQRYLRKDTGEVQVPSPAPWNPYHATCRPEQVPPYIEEFEVGFEVDFRPDVGFWIPVVELRTAGDALRWTCRLLGLGWLGSTNWDLILFYVAHGGPSKTADLSYASWFAPPSYNGVPEEAADA
jgi:predicted GIY-YIG superfamily endonuclease